MSLFSPEDSLDTRFYYSANDALSFFNSLSIQKKTDYFFNELIDLFLIFNYSGLLLYFSTKMNFSRLFSFSPGMFDLIETFFILFYLQGSEWHLLLPFMGFITSLKWLSLGVFNLKLILVFYKRKSRGRG